MRTPVQPLQRFHQDKTGMHEENEDPEASKATEVSILERPAKMSYKDRGYRECAEHIEVH